MKPLPPQRYAFAEWKIGVVVPNDYCVPERNHHAGGFQCAALQAKRPINLRLL